MQLHLLHLRKPPLPEPQRQRTAAAVIQSTQCAAQRSPDASAGSSEAVSRRHLLAISAAGTGLSSQHSAAAFELPWGGAPPALSQRRLQPQLAAAFTQAIYDALLQHEQGLSEQDLQLEIYRLRDREYPYYRQTYAAELPGVPDLSDASGGLSNPAYFNFQNYIVWKVAARHVPGPSERQELNRRAGRLLAQRIAPKQLQLASQAASAADSDNEAVPEQLRTAIIATLQTLKAGGYVDDFRVAFDDLPNLPARPFGEPMSNPNSPYSAEAAGRPIFQVTLRGPADILASVSLRGEEDGWFGRAASGLLAAMLEAAGFPEAFPPDEYFFQDEWRGPTSLADKALLLLGDPLQVVEVLRCQTEPARSTASHQTHRILQD